MDADASSRGFEGFGGLVLAIFGPTASGKSAVAEALAERVAAEIVSADAMQAYRGLPILTNQPERPTRLVGIWPLDQEGSVGEYQRLAHAAIDEILAAGRTPVVVGGTGLYLRAALAELDLPPAPPPGARERWERLYDEAGAEAAHAPSPSAILQPPRVVHPNDRRRVVRPSSSSRPASRSRPSAAASGPTTRAIRRSSSASRSPPRRSSAGSRSARGPWSSAGWRRR